MFDGFAPGVIVGFVVCGVLAVLVGPSFLANVAALIRPAERWAKSHRDVEPKSTREVMTKAVEDLRREEPEAAAIVQAPPRVEPDRVPEKVEAADVEDDAKSKRLDRFDPDVTRLLRALRGWVPRSATYGDEQGYANSMCHFLRRSGIAREGHYETFPTLTLKLAGAARKLTPDFVFWERLLVEVKGDMSRSSDSDRSLGQLFRYLLAWKSKGPAILIVCGDCDPLLRLLIQQYVAIWRDAPFRLPVTVFFAKHETVTQVPMVATYDEPG